MSPPEVQERWHQVYEEAARRGGERMLVGAMLQRLDTRRMWGRVFMIASGLFLACLTVLFYRVLMRQS